MSKEYKIIVGTAHEVSLEVSRYQNEGWKVRDGQPVLVRGTPQPINAAGMMAFAECEPLFAQSLIRTMTDEDELFEGSKQNAKAPEQLSP